MLAAGKKKGAEQVEWAGGFGQRRRPAGVLDPSWNMRSVASIMFREGQHARNMPIRKKNHQIEEENICAPSGATKSYYPVKISNSK